MVHFLICILVQGSGSPFAPYISTFPKSHDCTLCWDDAAMKELKGMQQARLRAIAHFSHTHEHVFHHHLRTPIDSIILLKILMQSVIACTSASPSADVIHLL